MKLVFLLVLLAASLPAHASDAIFSGTVRSQADADERIQSKIVDYADPTGPGKQLSITSGALHSIIDSAALPSGGATSANQSTEITDLLAIDGHIVSLTSANHTDLSSFTTANHSDLLNIDADILALKSANHADLGALTTANHTDTIAISGNQTSGGQKTQLVNASGTEVGGTMKTDLDAIMASVATAATNTGSTDTDLVAFKSQNNTNMAQLHTDLTALQIVDVVPGNTSVDPGTVSVATTATVLTASDTSRRIVYIYNSGTLPIYFGFTANVTTSNGIPLAAGGTIIEDKYSGAIYGIVTAGTITARVQVGKK